MNRSQYKITNGCEANCKNCIHRSGGYKLNEYIYCDYCNEYFDADCNPACDEYEDDEPFEDEE